MKKKIFLIVSLCMLLVLSLAGCGENPKDVDYNGYTYDQLKEVSQGTANALTQMTDKDMDNYLMQSADEISINLLKRWKDMKDSVGEFKGFGDFTVEKSGKTLTAAQVMNFSKRNVTLTCVYHYTTMDLEDITLDEIYTVGEKMQKAAMNTVMGLGTVFLILILISLIISCFKVIPYLQKKAEEKKRAAQELANKSLMPQEEARPAEPAAVQEDVPLQDDLELVAVIAAAISAASGIATDDFVVRSIKRR